VSLKQLPKKDHKCFISSHFCFLEDYFLIQSKTDQ